MRGVKRRSGRLNASAPPGHCLWGAPIIVRGVQHKRGRFKTARDHPWERCPSGCPEAVDSQRPLLGPLVESPPRTAGHVAAPGPTRTPMEVDLGPLDRFGDRSVQLVTLDSKEWAVARWEGELFVFRNVCPHRAGPVGRGALLSGLICKSVDSLSKDDGEPVVVCPWHRWEFELRSGRAVRESHRHLRIYRARVVGARVVVDMDP
jgi:nitrite reductase (NADH) small subunit